tara:strand:+ start:602 stop:1093 length:492 start_codon:yes stop_codon:yes gene_type:complete
MNPQSIELRDIRYPSEIDWWPMAPGWWIVIILIVTLLFVVILKLYQKYNENKARRAALSWLKNIQNDNIIRSDTKELTKTLSTLLRRTMLAYLPRNEVANLVGDRWLDFLDQGLDENYFSQGEGRCLITTPYEDSKSDENIDVEKLLDIVRMRIMLPIKKEGN